MQSATNPLRKGLLALVFASAGFSSWAGPDTSVTLTLDQARAAAAQALEAGRPGDALTLARGLAAALPHDPLPHFVIASAHAQAGQPRDGRRAAARAFRLSKSPDHRFQAGQMAARLAVAEDRHSIAQYWLRRSANNAPTAEARKIVARDFRTVRALNPWRVSLDGGLRPSSNVNNGSEEALQVIDGVPVTGFLSPAAQALSGVIATANLSVSYRLRATANSATLLTAQYYMKRVRLSGDARAQAPTASNSMFSADHLSFGLRHAFAVPQNGSAALSVSAGASRSGDRPTYQFARIGGSRSWAVAEHGQITLSAEAEERFSQRGTRYDARALNVALTYGRALENGDRLSLRFGMRDTSAAHFNDTGRTFSLRTSYAFKDAFGPVRVSAGLTLGHSDRPHYRSGFIAVPGGRQDTSLYADVNLMFEQIDYAGFSPSLRLRAGRTKSNDSRFTTREVSVAFGIESNF